MRQEQSPSISVCVHTWVAVHLSVDHFEPGRQCATSPQQACVSMNTTRLLSCNFTQENIRLFSVRTANSSKESFRKQPCWLYTFASAFQLSVWQEISHIIWDWIILSCDTLWKTLSPSIHPCKKANIKPNVRKRQIHFFSLYFRPVLILSIQQGFLYIHLCVAVGHVLIFYFKEARALLSLSPSLTKTWQCFPHIVYLANERTTPSASTINSWTVSPRSTAPVYWRSLMLCREARSGIMSLPLWRNLSRLIQLFCKSL